MAISQLVRDRFEKRHGCTIEVAAEHMRLWSRLIIPRKHKIADEEMIGRGYVHFGKGVDADEMDQESRRILRHW